MPFSSPIARSVIPKALGIDGPVTSASRIAVLKPFFWKLTASIEETIDFPTPPLPLITPMTFFILLSLCGGSIKLFGSLLSQFALQFEQSCVHVSSIIIFLLVNKV